jgi:hypothetical protein
VIQLAHDSTAGGHPGRSKTYGIIARAYWWPSMHTTINKFIRNCYVCRRSKPFRERYQRWLRPLFTPERRWANILMDYVGPLQPNTFMGVTYLYILVFVNRFTKMRHIVPTTSLEPKKTANTFYQNVWKLHGLPNNITTDRGTQFTSIFWKTLCARLRIGSNLSISFYPETDGQTERANAIMEHYLRAYVNY